MTVVNTPCWIVVRRRVTLAGHVIAAPAASGAERAGLEVSSDASAEQLRELQLRAARVLDEDWHAARCLDTREVSATSVDLESRYYAQVRSDGLYFFLDLPAGNYVLSGKDECGRPIETKPVSIPPVSGPGMLPVLGVDLIAQANQGQIAERSMVTGQRSAPARRRRQSNEERG